MVAGDLPEHNIKWLPHVERVRHSLTYVLGPASLSRPAPLERIRRLVPLCCITSPLCGWVGRFASGVGPIIMASDAWTADPTAGGRQNARINRRVLK